MPVRAEVRLLGYAAGLTAVVGVLAGVIGSLSLSGLPFLGGGLDYLAEDISGPAPVLANRVLLVLFGAVAALYVLLPVGIGWYYVRYGERHPLYYAVLASVAVLGLPGLGLVVGLLAIVTADELLMLALVAGCVGVLAVAFRVALDRGPDEPDEGHPWMVFANLGLVAVLLLGVSVGTVGAGGAVSGLVERQSVSPPMTAFEANYTAGESGRGVLTIRHAGGDAVVRDRLYLRGDGFAAVDGVDQTESGRWRGETSTNSAGEGPFVTVDDTVRVGVQADCTLRLVYTFEEFEDHRRTLAEFDCAAVRERS